MQLEDYLRSDDRIVLPLGSTEQHAYLSLGTDNILAERVAVEAAAPLGVPVLPFMPYGITPSFGAYPGSPSLRVETLLAVVRDLLDSLYRQGFRRFLIVNGHGGNTPVRAGAGDWLVAHEDAQVIYHDWFYGPKVLPVARTIGDPTHANWNENFPWTRLAGVELPTEPKVLFDAPPRVGSPHAVREALDDGSFGGPYQVADEEVLRVWRAGVEEVRNLLANGWRD